MKTFVIHNKTEDEAEILLYDSIGDDWFGGVSAKTFAEQLKSIKAKKLTVRINSPGGRVFDGFAMYESLKRFPGEVHVAVDGLAASAASVVAMAGKSIAMGQSSFLMIHDPYTLTIGNAAEHARTIDLLDKVGGNILDVYVRRTKNDAGAVKAWMAEEKWFTADEAVEQGFADSIAEAPPVAARLAAWLKPPEAILARLREVEAAQAQQDASLKEQVRRLLELNPR